LVFVPVKNATASPTFLVGFFELHSFLDPLLATSHRLGFSLEVRSGDEVVYRKEEGQPLPGQSPWRQELSFSLRRVPWKLAIWPSPRTLVRERSGLPELVLGFGFLLSGLLGLAAYLGQVARARSREVGQLVRELRHEMRERGGVEDEVRARNRDLQTLLFVVSHDLKEPLRAIASFSLMLEERHREELATKGRDLLDRIRRAALRLERLLDDITTLSRAQRMENPDEVVDLGEVVAEVCARLEAQIEEKRAKIRVIGELPAVKTQGTWMAEAVYNLVSNALKFTQEGVAPEVEIAAYQDSGSCQGVVVRDRGRGVPEGQEERIFELFKRAVGRKIEGTGAGLAIVRQIAERHGGRAWVQARPGGGSEFYLCLTVAAVPEVED
jgi:signal transduction histidine kinase